MNSFNLIQLCRLIWISAQTAHVSCKPPQRCNRWVSSALFGAYPTMSFRLVSLSSVISDPFNPHLAN